MLSAELLSCLLASQVSCISMHAQPGRHEGALGVKQKGWHEGRVTCEPVVTIKSSFGSMLLISLTGMMSLGSKGA